MKLTYSVSLVEGQSEEDVDLSEFSDEIESWVIDELNRIGLDTAKSVLAFVERRVGKKNRSGRRNSRGCVEYSQEGI